MDDSLITAITTRGYWKIVLEPAAPRTTPDLLNVNRCLSVVRDCSVSLRGWDYPHTEYSHADHGRLIYADDFVESWTDWSSHREFWRMHTNAQFIHYRALKEDWPELEARAPKRRRHPSPVLGVGTTIWLLAEIFEFLSRLVSLASLYPSGATACVTLHSGPTPRALWIEEPGRFSLSFPRELLDHRASFAADLTHEQTMTPKPNASRCVLELFRHFNWFPTPELITDEIDKVYRLW